MPMPFTGSSGNIGGAADALGKIIKDVGPAAADSKKLVVLSYDKPFRDLAESNVDAGLTKKISDGVGTSRNASKTAIDTFAAHVTSMFKSQQQIAANASAGLA